MGVIVRLSQVARRFGAHAAVDNIDLDIMEGEFFSLLGPSGSGKTTLLRIIGGFERPDHGSVSINARDMHGVPPERRPVNTVFQSYALFPTMSVFENVAYGLRVARVGRAEAARRVHSALDLVHMGDFAGRSVTTLSGGQTQRVALARAIILEPRVLLLDEPLGALDLKLRQAMQVEFKAIQKRLGITFVYVTHDQEEALTMSERIGVMNAGHLEQVGSPVEVYRRPVTAFVAAFVGNTNLIEPERGPSGAPLMGGAAILAPRDDRPGRLWSIRPEQILVGSAAATQPQQAKARIDDVVFLGSFTRYHLRVGEGAHAMRIIAVAASAAEMLRAGAETQIGWSPEDVIALEP
jgi:ABC-type Fe3+/spermidine/putrescine transport system ATPase subunit